MVYLGENHPSENINAKGLVLRLEMQRAPMTVHTCEYTREHLIYIKLKHDFD